MFSARGKCRACGPGRSDDNIEQMVMHRGPNFDHWRRQVAASVGAVLVDESRTEV